MTEKQLSVPDISCGHCKAAIEGALSKLSAVEKVEVDVDRKTVHVTFDPPEALAAITEAIEEQGYEVK